MRKEYRGLVGVIAMALGLSFVFVTSGLGKDGLVPLLALTWVTLLCAAWLQWRKLTAGSRSGDVSEPSALQGDGEPAPARDPQARLARLKASAEAERDAAAAHGVRMAGSVDLDRRGEAASAELPSAAAEDASPPRARTGQAIDQARCRPIVFRPLYPPPAAAGLSFYGGLPIAPAGLAWPRGATKSGEAPLHFIMQWDCAALARQDPTGLLPADGALYLFCDLEWGSPLAYRFVHAPGPVDEWRELAVPDDLGPVYGDQGAWQLRHCSQTLPAEQQDVPRLLPKWPFAPIAFDYPLAEPNSDDEDAEERAFWNETAAVNEALLAAQNALGGPLAAFEPNRPTAAFARPFDAFPHDWAAVRVACVEAIDRLCWPQDLGRRFPNASEDELAAVWAQWRGDAQEVYLIAASHPSTGAVPQHVSDDFWRWLETMEPAIGLGFARIVEESVNTSLGLRSEAVRAIPGELIAAGSIKHSLAHEYWHEEYPPHARPGEMEAYEERKERGELAQVREIHALSPDRMFGPPSYVQGSVEERIPGRLLLLELSGRDQIGHHFGEGVFQFLIRPEDLAAGRFEQVEVILTAF